MSSVLGSPLLFGFGQANIVSSPKGPYVLLHNSLVSSWLHH